MDYYIFSANSVSLLELLLLLKNSKKNGAQCKPDGNDGVFFMAMFYCTIINYMTNFSHPQKQ